jgi:hypothetical protein
MTYISNMVRSEGDPKVLRAGPSSLTGPDRLGKALGWFSLGLGLVELFAPRPITRALGMEGQEALVCAYGVREISSGVLSLSTEKTLGLWGRVGGDGIDIATLLTASREDNPKKQNVTTALALVAGITLLDIVAAQSTTVRHRRVSGDPYIYRDRSGFPKGLVAARGAARDFEVPIDMRAAPALAAASDRGGQEWVRPH